jgi:hypothetical protein
MSIYGGTRMDFLKKRKTLPEKSSFHYELPACRHLVQDLIYDYMMEFNQSFTRDIVFLCIGN